MMPVFDGLRQRRSCPEAWPVQPGVTLQGLNRRRMLAVGATAVLAMGCSRKPLKGNAIPMGATVLALGDSLTFGSGATPEQAYPHVLASLTGWLLINAGVPGNSSAQALERLPGLLEEHRPALVLLGIGGNDLLRRQPEAGLKDNIRQSVQLCRAAQSQVLLIAMPRVSLGARVTSSLDDHPLYGALSEELQVPLHRRGWADVLQNEQWRSDAIHANAQGYEQFARTLMATLRATGLHLA